MTDRRWTVLVTGGAGYVGSVLVPRLLAEGHNVKVIDLYLYGRDIFAAHRGPRLTEIQGDIRDPIVVAEAVKGCDAVIHLACISNDPSFDLDPSLGKSINFDCFRPLVKASKTAGVERFVYASSSSVYGVKDVPNVTEDEPLDPLTDYSKYKALCEDVLAEERAPGFTTLTVRPATVCGYGPRLRLDLTVNILTSHAYFNNRIRVFGGGQKRPNIHIADMVEFYVESLRQPHERIDGKTFNAGYENHKVQEIAEMVRDVVGKKVEIAIEPTNDHRSYHISSEKVRRELGFVARHTISQAAEDLVRAFHDGKVSNWDSDPRYSNIKLMKAVHLA
ncbi:MAG: NAD-dependent epimerase/dehydratase family protein [Reyranella sp.]|nr:NAD-dependent epimerase/dehydratase family protein [Reyranella sp.]